MINKAVSIVRVVSNLYYFCFSLIVVFFLVQIRVYVEEVFFSLILSYIISVFVLLTIISATQMVSLFIKKSHDLEKKKLAKLKVHLRQVVGMLAMQSSLMSVIAFQNGMMTGVGARSPLFSVTAFKFYAAIVIVFLLFSFLATVNKKELNLFNS